MNDGGAMMDHELKYDKIRRELAGLGADAILLAGNMNLYYTTGRIVNGYFYLPMEGAPVLFARLPDGVPDAVKIRKPEQIPDILQERGYRLPKRLLLDEGDITADEWLRLCAVFADTECLGGTGCMRKVRSVKTPQEIERIREGARKHAEVTAQYPSLYRPGMSDLEFSAAMEHFARINGHLGIFRTFGFRMEAYMGTVLAGENGGVPSPYDFALGGAGSDSLPLGVRNQRMEDGESVMADISGNFNGYLTDISRTYSIGRLPDEAYRAHAVSLEIQQYLMERAKEGACTGELYEDAVRIAASNGLADCFMGLEQKAKFIGHGVGLQINELPVIAKNSRSLLEAGNVIALEPKFVLEGIGAVGTENTYLITETGLELLTDCPQDLINLLE